MQTMVVPGVQSPFYLSKTNSALPSQLSVPRKRQEFFWVNSQNNSHQSPGFKGDRAKHSFVSARRHHLRKQEQLRTLKDSIRPFPAQDATTRNSDRDKGHVQNADTGRILAKKQHLPSNLLDPLSFLAIPMTYDMKLYFHHCMHPY